MIAVTSLVLMPSVTFAQFGGGPADECKISKDMAAGKWKIMKGASAPATFQLYRDNNGDGIWADPTERLPDVLYVGLAGVRDVNVITIPHSAEATMLVGDFTDIKKGDTLPATWATFCIVNTVNNIVNWIFFILVSIAFAFVALAGFKWMASQGNAEKQGEAGKMIFAALVGIIIAALAKAIPAVIIGLLT